MSAARHCPAGHGPVGGRPCRACRVELLVARVLEADPSLAERDVRGALEAVAAHGAALRDLARALAEGTRPLFVGAPPSVGRLVVALRARGSVLAEPACVRCGRTNRVLTASAEGGVCPRCRARQLACACAGCGGVKPVAARDAEGRALCAACASRPRRPCSRCGHVRIIARRARDRDGDLCDRCYRGPVATCGRCGKAKPCNFVAEGRPICRSCSPRRRVACAHCGEERPATARWAEGPVCESCYRAALGRSGTCSGCLARRRLVDPPGPGATRCAECAGVAGLARCGGCGAEERPYRGGRCVRCALAEVARTRLGGHDGPLGPLYDALVAAPQPYSAMNWLRSGVSAAIAADVAAGVMPLTHEALDAHPHPRAASYLRHILVAHGVLAPRDDALVALEAWVQARLASLAGGEHVQVLRSYATWRVLRRARQRSEASRRPRTSTARAKTCLNAAIAFMGFLDEHGTGLAEATQADIDAWMVTGPPSAPDVADFVDWATERKLLAGVVVSRRRRSGGPALDHDARWEIVGRLLHDDTVEVGDRVAGCIVLLYGCQLSRVAALTADQISDHEGNLRLHLGATHIEVLEPLVTLFRRLVRTRRPTNPVIPAPEGDAWMFPGLDPGRPVGAQRLGQRLRRLGIPTMAARRSGPHAPRTPDARRGPRRPPRHRPHDCRSLGPCCGR